MELKKWKCEEILIGFKAIMEKRFPSSSFEYISCPNCPQQPDYSDCGPIVCDFVTLAVLECISGSPQYLIEAQKTYEKYGTIEMRKKLSQAVVRKEFIESDVVINKDRIDPKTLVKKYVQLIEKDIKPKTAKKRFADVEKKTENDDKEIEDRIVNNVVAKIAELNSPNAEPEEKGVEIANVDELASEAKIEEKHDVEEDEHDEQIELTGYEIRWGCPYHGFSFSVGEKYKSKLKAHFDSVKGRTPKCKHRRRYDGMTNGGNWWPSQRIPIKILKAPSQNSRKK